MDRTKTLVNKGIEIANLAISLLKEIQDLRRSYFDNSLDKGSINELKTEDIQPYFNITADAFGDLINFFTQYENLLNFQPVTQGDWLAILNKVRSNY